MQFSKNLSRFRAEFLIIYKTNSKVNKVIDLFRDFSLLLRKEVIHPHLPVRIPCYDFTPITNPTFDGSPSYELSHRLRVLPTFVV